MADLNEQRGDGEPLVLLHPGMADARAFDPNIDALADRFRVYTPERRGHGRTPDVEGPSTYEWMARDTIGFLENVMIGDDDEVLLEHAGELSDGAHPARVIDDRPGPGPNRQRRVRLRRPCESCSRT